MIKLKVYWKDLFKEFRKKKQTTITFNSNKPTIITCSV